MSKRGKKPFSTAPMPDVRSREIRRVRMFSRYSKRLTANATLDGAGVLTIEVEMTPLWRVWLRAIKGRVIR